jgi:hypothetical protein
MQLFKCSSRTTADVCPITATAGEAEAAQHQQSGAFLLCSCYCVCYLTADAPVQQQA